MEGVKYRKSGAEDSVEIEALFKSCFYDFDADEESYMNPLYNLDGRYMVAEYDDKIIGMAGVCYNKKLDRYDVDYMCVKKEYRCNGITEHMFSTLISEYKHKEIWFEAWRSTWDDRAEKFFNKLGFKRYQKSYLIYAKRFHKCSNCVLDTGRDCACTTDLYVHKPLVALEDLLKCQN